MEPWRMAWVCTELLALWVGLPVLLWLEALPPASRLFILGAAALYGLWIVLRERVPWNRLGFRGPRFLLASLRTGLPWVAAAWPLLVGLVALLGGVPGTEPAADARALVLGLVHYARMFLDLAAAHAIALDESTHVGDSVKDRDAAFAAGIADFRWAKDFFESAEPR